jgi:hypothetical protein
VYDNDTEESANGSFHNGNLDGNDKDINRDRCKLFCLFYKKKKKDFLFDLSFAVPDECQNEVVTIESFYARLANLYNVCLMFFSSSLQDVCQAAFN